MRDKEYKEYVERNIKLIRQALVNIGAIKYTDDGWVANMEEINETSTKNEQLDEIMTNLSEITAILTKQNAQLEAICELFKSQNGSIKPDYSPVETLDHAQVQPNLSLSGLSDSTNSSKTIPEEPIQSINLPKIEEPVLLKDRLEAQKNESTGTFDPLAEQVNRNKLAK